MKKTFILLATVFGIVSANAQFVENNDSRIKIENKKTNKLHQKFDYTTFNKVKLYGSPAEAMKSSKGNKKTQEDLQPFASIHTQGWGFGTNVDNGEFLFFGIETKFDADAYVQFQLYDDNLKVEKQFKISIPETANSVQVVSDFSSKIIANNTKLIIPIYLHYFEGGIGPEFQKNEIWFVSETGDIVNKVDAWSLVIMNDSKGNPNVFSFSEVETETEAITLLKSVDLNDASNTKVVSYDSLTTYFYAGIPISFKTINGKDYLVFAHYTEKLVDNNTLEFNQNSKFVLDFIDYETFTINKSYQLPVFGFDEENPYTIPMATFGMFYNDDKYDISSTIYNSDSKLEFTYGTQFYDMMGDQTWYNYYVVNEDGTVIKTIEDRISNVGAEIGVTLEEVAGQNDQIVALVGEGDMVSNLRVYNLPNFDLVYDFPAMHNDDLLSLNFNRIPAENSYHYVIGLSQFETDADKKYGVVKHYNSSGKEVNKVRLPVTNESERFSVFLTETTLDPKIVNDDDKIEYVYAYQDRINDVQANTYAIAQDENNVIATFSGRTDKGNVNSAGYLTNRKGEFDRLYIYYGGDYSATSFLTEFYKLPMQTLKVNDISNAKQSIKYLSNVNQIRIDYDYQTYQVYSVNGNLISSGNSVQTIFTNGWNKGVYIIKTIDKQGKANTAKILVF